MSPDSLSVVLRALSFVALLQAAGIALFMAMFSRHLLKASGEVRRLGMWSAAVALPLLTAQLGLEAARMAGDFAGVADLSLQRLVLSSPAAAAFGARVLGLIVIGCAFLGSDRVTPLVAFAGSLLVAASFTLMGHAAPHAYRWLLGPALATHVLIAAFWLGAIPALYLATLREQADHPGRLVEAFSRVAIWIVPVLAVAGGVMALVLIRTLAVFAQPYGWLLLAKITGFTMLMGLAVANRWRLGPAVALGTTGAFKRSLTVEYIIIVCVLTATAAMTSLYSPDA